MLISCTSGKLTNVERGALRICLGANEMCLLRILSHIPWKKEMKQKNTLTRILTSSYLSKGKFQVLPYFDDFWVVLVDHKYIVDNQEEMVWPCTKA